MPKISAKILVVLTLLGAGWTSCHKTEQPQTEFIKDYFPLEVGQYTIFSLDSTIYTHLDFQREVRSYLLEEVVDAEVTDNLGRKGFRIRRLLRDDTDTTIWRDQSSYIAIPFDHTLEFIDNNQRVVRLHEPIRVDFSWKGNSYLNTEAGAPLDYMRGWDYTFTTAREPFTADNGISFPETATVFEQADSTGIPNGDRGFYWDVTRASSVFAKGKGLVYREFFHEVWQPPNIICPEGCFDGTSYGIKLRFLTSNR
jgi:hypothetical protein